MRQQVAITILDNLEYYIPELEPSQAAEYLGIALIDLEDPKSLISLQKKFIAEYVHQLTEEICSRFD